MRELNFISIMRNNTLDSSIMFTIRAFLTNVGVKVGLYAQI